MHRTHGKIEVKALESSSMFLCIYVPMCLYIYSCGQSVSKDFNKPVNFHECIIKGNGRHANHIGFSPIGNYSLLRQCVKNPFTILLHQYRKLTTALCWVRWRD